ncbi:MAG: transglycosylase SLT domain-containing protein, partial [Alphaproteobacteria bacterium]|nr:transglycosylase SLT domain-containing protein [Alphaproteobacteria bacterium]
VNTSRPAPRPTLPDISIIAEGGPAIRWALRGDAPALLRSAVAFSTEIARGSLIGNLLAAQYIDVPGGEETIRARADLSRLQDTLPLIQRHAGRYDVDWRLALALAYQESKLDQSRQSQAGAVGIMQVLPTTAADPNVGIGDISEADANIQAGIKYLAFLRARYFSDPAIAPADRIYLTLAAYNAGPGAVLRAQKRATENGLNPNAWFGNVETALAETVSREPVTYVRNIRKYFVGLTLADASGAVAEWGAPTGFGRIVALARIWWPLVVAYLSLLVIAAIGLRWRGAFVRARDGRRGAA